MSEKLEAANRQFAKLEAVNRQLARLEEERDSLRRELIGVQEMLAFVLKQVGEEVVVSKETLQEGLPEGSQISVEDDASRHAFVFSLVVPE